MHKIRLPHQILIGSKILDQIGNLCKKLGFPLKNNNRIVIITGPNTIKIAGKQIKDYLLEDKFEVQIQEVMKANLENVEKAENIIQEFKPCLVIGVGGGKNIDCAKLSSFNNNIPFISVPTALAHDGVASPSCSLKGLDLRHSIQAQTPIGILADTNIIKKAPRVLLSAGIGDLLSNLVAVKDWKLGHRIKNEYFGHYSALLSRMSAELILKNYEKINPSEESIRIVLEGIISSSISMTVAGSSRPASGSEHLFSHALDKLGTGKLHGYQVGLGSIMLMYLHNGNWQEIRDALRFVNAPVNAEELGIDDETVIKALTIAHKIRNRYTILQTGLTRNAAENLAKNTGVIN
ncbi:MAG: NAD(P)-dependent glycerol-1-phosphate dehydrogenase [Candidatus Lokiarchaeota archaeon]|nr:NAD(P)-dependent glycerol-1-phosphate dehydrogenase [Candidatus Lokiarchaeota archaeon]